MYLNLPGNRVEVGRIELLHWSRRPLVKGQRKFAGVVLVSDQESWVYKGRAHVHSVNGSTGVMTEWQQFVKHQHRLQGVEMPGPKLICIDLQPYQATQALEREDILNVGGFSDAVFDVIPPS